MRLPLLPFSALCLLFWLPPSVSAAELRPLTRQFQIINASSVEINHVYISPTNLSIWGDDQLGDTPEDVVEPGSAITLTGVSDETYDVELLFSNGAVCIKREVKFDSDISWTIDREFILRC